jgi:hypothetical protein
VEQDEERPLAPRRGVSRDHGRLNDRATTEVGTPQREMDHLRTLHPQSAACNRVVGIGSNANGYGGGGDGSESRGSGQ